VSALVLASGEAYIADDANESATRNKRVEAVFPNLTELTKKFVVILDVA